MQRATNQIIRNRVEKRWQIQILNRRQMKRIELQKLRNEWNIILNKHHSVMERQTFFISWLSSAVYHKGGDAAKC